MAQGVSTAELAYLGDAVFELLVREMLIADGVTARQIVDRAKEFVSAAAQSEMYHILFPHLTEFEQSIIKRGRNLHGASRSKNANVTQYRHATGLEALFGFLHNKGDTKRVQEIFGICIAEKSAPTQ